MRLLPWLTALCPALLIAAGCETDFYARSVLEQDATRGRLAETLVGDGETLESAGRVDLHRRITMSDGVEIDVCVLKARGEDGEPAGASAKGTMVLLHGLGESRAWLVSLGERLAGMGYDVVLPDLRAHGRSGGRYVTWGAREKRDIKSVIDALTIAGAVSEEVCVFGESMGGTIAILYGAIDLRCRGVMAMAPYKDFEHARKSLILVAPAISDADWAKVRRRAAEIGEFDPSEASALDAAGKLDCPLLLVHGELDVITPAAHSKALFEAADEPKKLILVPWANHNWRLLHTESWIAEQLDTMATTGRLEKTTAPESNIP